MANRCAALPALPICWGHQSTRPFIRRPTRKSTRNSSVCTVALGDTRSLFTPWVGLHPRRQQQEERRGSGRSIPWNRRLQRPKSVNIQQLLFIGEHVFKAHDDTTTTTTTTDSSVGGGSSSSSDDMAAYVSRFVSVLRSVEFNNGELLSRSRLFVVVVIDQSKCSNATR